MYSYGEGKESGRVAVEASKIVKASQSLVVLQSYPIHSDARSVARVTEPTRSSAKRKVYLIASMASLYDIGYTMENREVS